MSRSRLWIIGLAVGLALMLLTVYLAIFIAPLPQTGVRSANEIMESLKGDEIKVAGFVSDIYSSSSSELNFALADFFDFVSWQGNLSELNTTEWYSVRPIDVSIQLNGDDLSIEKGTNLSVLAVIVDEHIGPNSEVTGYSLLVEDVTTVEIGTSSANFPIETAPVAQKIFYFHMPLAWVSYVAFFVTLLCSILYLKKRYLDYDNIAQPAVEIGIVFASIALLTGAIWAKQEWGVYWRWEDTKLLTTFILWLVYIGYLSLRAAVVDPGARARTSAVYGILAFITVPMSFLSSRIAPLLRSSHPQVIATESGGLSPEAGMAVGMAVIAFTILFLVMLAKRVKIVRMEQELEEIKKEVGGES